MAGLGLALLLPAGAWAQKAAVAPSAPASVPTIPLPVAKVENSYLTGPLLRQLLDGGPARVRDGGQQQGVGNHGWPTLAKHFDSVFAKPVLPKERAGVRSNRGSPDACRLY